jgi:hypothetical protein
MLSLLIWGLLVAWVAQVPFILAICLVARRPAPRPPGLGHFLLVNQAIRRA